MNRKNKIWNWDYSKVNSYLLVAFLFSSSITLPFKYFFGSGVPVYIYIFTILLLSIYVNIHQMNKTFLIMSIIIIFILCIDNLLVSFKEISLYWSIEFIKFGLIPLYLACNKLNLDSFYKSWYQLGVINLFIWILFFNKVNNGEIDYMFFGISLTYSFSIFLINLFYIPKNKMINVLFLVISFTMILLLANRIAIVICLILFSIILINRSHKSYSGKVFLLTYFLFISIIVKKFLFILNHLKFLTDALGYNSYFINKAIYLMNFGFEAASSGRNLIYNEAYKLIKESNYMPNGIGYFQFKTNVVYPHNILLDITISFGIIGLIIFLTLFVIGLFSYKYNKNNDLKLVILVLSTIVFIRLFFSGTYLTEIPLWIIIGLLINKKISYESNKEQKNDKAIN